MTGITEICLFIFSIEEEGEGLGGKGTGSRGLEAKKKMMMEEFFPCLICLVALHNMSHFSHP